MQVPQPAIDLILKFEGLDQPGQWPGESSGITLGHGYDLGYTDYATFRRDWTGHLTLEQIACLKPAIGRTGLTAKAMSPKFADIRVTREAAAAVFATATLPKYTRQTAQAFPGIEHFPALVFGALVSLVFNRGTSMIGERRAEMVAIRDIIRNVGPTTDGVRMIASQIRSMKRLWVGKHVDGLLRRRDAEAAMVVSTLY